MVKYALDVPVPIASGVSYVPLRYHRGRPSRHKTVWRISVGDELDTFRVSHSSGWLWPGVGWGLRQAPAGNILTLGTNARNADLKFAKFISSTPTSDWHGYPADYLAKPGDCPHMAVLQVWIRVGILRKHHVKKIVRGQPCNL